MSFSGDKIQGQNTPISFWCRSALPRVFLLFLSLFVLIPATGFAASPESSPSPRPTSPKPAPTLMTLSLGMHPIQADQAIVRQGYRQSQWLSEPPFTRRVYTAGMKDMPLQRLELVVCQATARLVEIRFQGNDRKSLYALAREKSELGLREPPPSTGPDSVDKRPLFGTYQETYQDKSRLTLSAEGQGASLLFESPPEIAECRAGFAKDMQDMNSFRQEQGEDRDRRLRQTF